MNSYDLLREPVISERSMEQFFDRQGNEIHKYTFKVPVTANKVEIKNAVEEIFKVKDKETAEKVIEDVMNEYTPDGAQIREIVVDKKISTNLSTVKRKNADQEVMTEEEAVDYVLEQNSLLEIIFF